ncbi:MAG: hypothetical protein HY650_00190 [Acidobacteria bacterium]|nr:hypothetical protein [Acidobacteriota bacterium]
MRNQRAVMITLFVMLSALGIQEASGQDRSSREKPAGAVEITTQQFRAVHAGPAGTEAFGESVLGTDFTVNASASRDFPVSVGGAARLSFSLLTGALSVGQIRVVAFFGSPGAQFATAAEGGLPMGVPTPFPGAITGSVPVHGSLGILRVFNDGTSPVLVTQLTAYWVY